VNLLKRKSRAGSVIYLAVAAYQCHVVAVPLFSLRAVPARVRLILSVAMTFVVMPLLPAFPAVDMFSYEGIRVAIAQVMIGLSSGFIVQLVFAAVVFAGQGVALSMGLGFASMVDPQNGQQVPVIAQLMSLLVR